MLEVSNSLNTMHLVKDISIYTTQILFSSSIFGFNLLFNIYLSSIY